jgi:hypothetical protein
MLAAEATHRDHAIIEQAIAGLKDSALAHLPSGAGPPRRRGSGTSRPDPAQEFPAQEFPAQEIPSQDQILHGAGV